MRFPSAAFLAGALALLSCAGARASDAPFPPAKRAAIEAALHKSLAATKAPGVVVGIWIPGEGSYVAAKGVSNLATKKPMQLADHFRIGSITKTFTVTLLLMLADEGKVGLDDPVSKYVSYVPNGDRITLRMLANMTSGLASYTEDDAWVRLAFSNYQRAWTPRELMDVSFARKPDFAPGQGWHYSNTNTVLLGVIIEQVTGKPIGEVLAEKIYKPLKMTQTSFPTTSAMPSPYARGITVQSLDGKQQDATMRNPTWGFTAGQMISTVADLHTWVVSYTTGTLISPAMQKERLTWVTFPPNTPVKHYGMGIGEANGWLGHTGELPGYNCAAYYLPSKRAAIVVMVNSDIAVGGSDPAPAIFRAIAAVVTPGAVPQ